MPLPVIRVVGSERDQLLKLEPGRAKCTPRRQRRICADRRHRPDRPQRAAPPGRLHRSDGAARADAPGAVGEIAGWAFETRRHVCIDGGTNGRLTSVPLPSPAAAQRSRRRHGARRRSPAIRAALKGRLINGPDHRRSDRPGAARPESDLAISWTRPHTPTLQAQVDAAR